MINVDNKILQRYPRSKALTNKLSFDFYIVLKSQGGRDNVESLFLWIIKSPSWSHILDRTVGGHDAASKFAVSFLSRRKNEENTLN